MIAFFLNTVATWDICGYALGFKLLGQSHWLVIVHEFMFIS